MPEISPADIIFRSTPNGSGPIAHVGLVEHDGVRYFDLTVWTDPSQAGQLGFGCHLRRVPTTCLPAVLEALMALEDALEAEAEA